MREKEGEMIEMLEILPNEIKIGWKTYNVEFSSARLNSGEELYGQINYDNGTITIRECSTPDQIRATLIHEVLHAISEMYGMGLEEKLVTDLANALYTVYKDNNDANRKNRESITGKLVNPAECESQYENHKSPYGNDPEGGIAWLFAGTPRTKDKRIKIRIEDMLNPHSIEASDVDNAVLFLFNHDQSDLEVCDYAKDSAELIWMLTKIKEKIETMQ